MIDLGGKHHGCKKHITHSSFYVQAGSYFLTGRLYICSTCVGNKLSLIAIPLIVLGNNRWQAGRVEIYKASEIATHPEK